MKIDGSSFQNIVNQTNSTFPLHNVTKVEETMNSFIEFGHCMWDSFFSWRVFFSDPTQCFTKLGQNIRDGANDIAQITASVAFMYFLWRIVRIPEKDAHHHFHTTVIAPVDISSKLYLKPLQDVIKENPLLLLQFTGDLRVTHPNDGEEYIEITAEKLGISSEEFKPFWMRKFDYNKIAEEHGFPKE